MNPGQLKVALAQWPSLGGQEPKVLIFLETQQPLLGRPTMAARLLALQKEPVHGCLERTPAPLNRVEGRLWMW